MLLKKLIAIMLVLGALSVSLLTGCQSTGQPLPAALTGDPAQVEKVPELEHVARGHRYERDS